MRLTKDKEKMRSVLKAFTEKMEERLFQKADEGLTGWDERGMTLTILQDLTDDALMAEREMNGIERKTLIDIANRAMMLWYQNNS